MEKQKYYISTAIAYTSGKPHIGNTYEIVLADAIARFKRLEGYDVYFQTGTDEHGEKIELKAKDLGKTPKQFVDEISTEIKKIWDIMNTSYDKFVRTTDEIHERQVQKIFKKMYDKGDIYLGEYKGLYCTPCESFWTESQLVDGKCPDCGREVSEKCEEAYFFKLSKYQKQLEEYLEGHKDLMQPVTRYNEMYNNFLKPGLEDLCVSRTSFDWGVKVRKDPKDIEIGDILSYYSTNSYFGSTPITHRVVEKFNTANGYTFRTKGDANPVPDSEIIDEAHVIGVTKMVIPQLGRVQFFLASKFGWFTLILIPAVGVIIYDILKLFKLIKIKNKMQSLEEETEEKPKESVRK